jgi:hypothetical protein
MNRATTILKVIALSIVSLVAAIFFWPFAVAGISAFFVSGMRFNRRVSSAFALLAAVCWRLGVGEWPLRIGEGSSTILYLEAFRGIVNWAFASIFVSAFAHWPAKLVEGYRSTAANSA